MIKFILKKALPVPKIESFDSYLFVGPHPDDIEIGAGATVAKLISMGKKVTFLIATDGRYGTEDESINLDDFVKTRQSEALEGAKHLGVDEVIFLPFEDGGLYSVTDMTVAIAKQIARIRPDMVFAPDPKLPNEMHLDHINCGNAVSSAVVMSMAHRLMQDLGETGKADVKAIGLYYTSRPNRYVKVRKTLKVAGEAILKHKSQFPTDTPEQKKIANLLLLYLRLHTLRYGIRRLAIFAQGFRVYSSMHLHCAPEAAK